MNRSISVVVVEREPLFRLGLVSSLDSVSDIDVVAVAHSREETMRVLGQSTPDVAVVGTIAQGPSGIELAADLRRHAPAVATIVISADETDDELFAAVRAGVSAYCGRDVEEATLHDLVRRSADGEYVINEQLLHKPYVASRVLDQFRNAAAHRSNSGGESNTNKPLTDREVEVLRHISTGMTNAEIAYVLGISQQTVKNHVTSILRKLSVQDRTQAVVVAIRNGWLTIDDSGKDNGKRPPHRSPSTETTAESSTTRAESDTDH